MLYVHVNTDEQVHVHMHVYMYIHVCTHRVRIELCTYVPGRDWCV